MLTLTEIEACYADGKGMEEFARAIERRVLANAEEARSAQEAVISWAACVKLRDNTEEWTRGLMDRLTALSILTS